LTWTALVVAVAFRLPLAWHGAAGYTTPDGALSGSMALHLRDGGAHDVFIPHIPYSGSLKAHVTAALAWLGDPCRAFALASVSFYALFVAGLVRLAWLVRGERTAAAAGLFAALSPTFVTQYSLSNDGNYVEVLALGTWALVVTVAWLRATGDRTLRALAIGLLLGTAFWCHILAILYGATIACVLLLADLRSAARALPWLAAGFILGYFPGLLWNAGHDWDSFRALLPGQQLAAPGAAGPGLLRRAGLLVTDYGPVLLGYDSGYSRPVDLALIGLAWISVALALLAALAGVRRAWRSGWDGDRLLLAFAAVDLVVCATTLRYVPGNPRYLLFLMTPLPILLADLLGQGWRRWLFALLIAFGALGSLAQARTKIAADARWRRFVADVERAGVTRCYTDFFLAAKLNFLSEERVLCSSKLGPNRTEYFFENRERVDASPTAALIAASNGHARRIEARMRSLGVAFQRQDLMRPLLLPARKVDPEELFPGESFGLR